MFVDEVYRRTRELQLVASRAEFSRTFLGQPATYYDDCLDGNFEPGPAAYIVLFGRLLVLGQLIRDQMAVDPDALILADFAKDVEQAVMRCANRLNGRSYDYPLDALDDDPLPPSLALTRPARVNEGKLRR